MKKKGGTHVRCLLAIPLLLVNSARLLRSLREPLLDVPRDGFVVSDDLLSERSVEPLDVVQEARRDPMLVVELDRALQDVIVQLVALREVLCGDCNRVGMVNACVVKIGGFCVLAARGLSLCSMCAPVPADVGRSSGCSCSLVTFSVAPSRLPPFSINAVFAADGFSKWTVAVCLAGSCSMEVIFPQNLVRQTCQKSKSMDGTIRFMLTRRTHGDARW